MAQDTVREVKARLSIEEVVKPYVTLRRAGRSLVGLCPFHKEKTGSFHVSPERGTYHCFGCGEGGDMFSFVEKAEGLDFKEALEMLAEKAGVKVEYAAGGRERSDKRERLRDAMNRATIWYVQNFSGSAAEAYAKERGLAEKVIQEWGLGFAPDTWRALLEVLQAAGFTAQELLAAGLIKEAEGKLGTYYDRFRNRLIFPIRDAAGRTVALTGRALSADDQAKYLNSPETDLYHKSEVLFGLDKAKDAIRQRGFALLVEGQVDALHCHQAGFENAIALSGTALTSKHVALIKRYSENLMLALDSDAAGLKATANAALLALSEGLRVKAARLPPNEDPADLLLRDAKDFAARIKGAQPVVEFFLAALGEREKDQARLLRQVEQVVLPLVRAIGSPLERERMAQAIARTLGLSTEAVKESLARMVVSGAGPGTPSRHETPPAPSMNRRTLLLAAVHAYPGTALAGRIKAEYNRITGDTAAFETALPEVLVFAVERQFGEAPAEEAADELLHAFEEAVIREAYQEAVRALRQAEATGDSAAIQAAGERCRELSKHLSTLAG